jgi:hypothetical protein
MDRQAASAVRRNSDHHSACPSTGVRAGRRLGRLALALSVLAGLACSLTTSATPPPAAPANLSDVKAIAHQIYDLVQAGQDLKPLLGGVFEGLGIPVLSASSDGNRGLAMIKAGKPAIFDVQLELIGQGYANGTALDLDSFLADLTDHGVQAASPSGPLTSAYLKAAMTGLIGRASYSPSETLPALVIALGQERAARLGLKATDPVWGDSWLDPLQYALLAYGVGFRGLHAVAALKPTNPAIPAGLNLPVTAGLAQIAPGFFDNLLNDLNVLNLPDYVICSLYATSHTQIVMIIGPQAVYHEQTDVTSPPPYRATITGNLLIAAPTSTQRDLLILAGCSVPANSGPLPGKTISWTLDGVAQQHGRFTQTDRQTKADGTATAIYETIAETVPQAGRIPPALHKAQGELRAEVIGLVEGHPKLAAAGHLAGGTAGSMPLELEIRYYADLALDIGGSFELPGRDATITHVIAQQTIPLKASNGTLQGSGVLQVSSSSTWNCGSGGTVQAKGAYTGQIMVVAAPGGANHDQLSFSLIPDLRILKSPVPNMQCTAGDLGAEAWGALVELLQAKFTLDSSTLTYAYTPPQATGTITFTLHAVTH